MKTLLYFSLSWFSLFSSVTEDTDKLDQLFAEARQHAMDKSIDKGVAKVEEFKKLAKTEKSLMRLGQMYFNFGFLARKTKDYPRSLGLYLKSIKVFKKIGATKKIYSALVNTSKVYELIADWDNCETIRQERLQVAKLMGNESDIMRSRFMLGLAQKHLHQYDSAMLNFETCLEYYSGRGGGKDMIKWMGKSYLELGICEFYLGRYGAADDYYAMAQMLSADSVLHAKALNGHGYVKYRIGDYNGALELFYEALDYKVSLGDSSLMITTLNNLGKVHYKRGEREEAIKYFMEAFKSNDLSGKEGCDYTEFADSHSYLDSLSRQMDDKYLLTDIGVQERWNIVSKPIVEEKDERVKQAQRISAESIYYRQFIEDQRHDRQILINWLCVLAFAIAIALLYIMFMRRDHKLTMATLVNSIKVFDERRRS